MPFCISFLIYNMMYLKKKKKDHYTGGENTLIRIPATDLALFLCPWVALLFCPVPEAKLEFYLKHLPSLNFLIMYLPNSLKFLSNTSTSLDNPTIIWLQWSLI